MKQRAKNGVPIIRLVKHVERDNFSMILYRIAKNLLQRGHRKDLVQLTPLHTMRQEGETHWWRDSLRWCGEHTLIYREGRSVRRGTHYMGISTKSGYIGRGHSLCPYPHSPCPSHYGTPCILDMLEIFSNNHAWRYFWFWHW